MVPKTSQERAAFGCACLQFNVKRGDVSHNRQLAMDGLHAAATAGAKLVVLPELWTTSFVKEISDTLVAASLAAEADVCQLSGELGLVVVGGGIEASEGQFYNRAQLFDHGRSLGSYRKMHLFSPIAESRLVSAGDQPLVADTSVGRVGVAICYDIRFPELCRYYFCQDAEVLAVPSQWPEARSTHWRTLLKARAIENQLFVVGCNRTGSETSLKHGDALHFPGDSRIIDPMGETISGGAGEDEPILGEIAPRKVKSMRRILPIDKDRRPEIYGKFWGDAWHGTPVSQRRP